MKNRGTRRAERPEKRVSKQARVNSKQMRKTLTLADLYMRGQWGRNSRYDWDVITASVVGGAVDDRLGDVQPCSRSTRRKGAGDTRTKRRNEGLLSTGVGKHFVTRS